uniref:ARAD1A09570p n=1 Tax=Blastobotrys adeninivorans TaxID=409370 RepID=A0A060T2M0_BLAAD
MSNPAFVLEKIGKFTTENREVPKLENPTDVIVRVTETGICGSDVHYWKTGAIGKYVVKGPLVLGHESSGVVEQVGPKVKGLKPGDRVCMEPGVPCRFCPFCRTGNYNQCEEMSFAATPPVDGTLQKYYRIAYDYCYKLPDHVSFELGALCEPTACAVQIVHQAKVRATDKVVVFGCGPIGLLCQSVVRSYGCKTVIGVDLSDSRLAFAGDFSATGTFKPPKKEEGEDNHQYLTRVTDQMKEQFNLGLGADVILEATGAEPCMQMGIYVAAPKARFVQAGMGRDFVNFPVIQALGKEIQWTGTLRYTGEAFPEALDLLASGQIDGKRLVTHKFKFDEAEKAFETAASGKDGVIKVVIEGVPN